MDTNSQNSKRQILLAFINKYLSKKDIRMKDLLGKLHQKLVSNKQITIGQFLAIAKFIEREKQFKNLSRSELIAYFSPIIQQDEENYLNDTSIHQHHSQFI